MKMQALLLHIAFQVQSAKMTIDGSGVVSLNNAANFESQPSYSFDLTVNDGTTTATEGITALR